MKVTRNTPDQLILSDTPWLIGIMLIFFILVFTGAGIAITISESWVGLIFAFFGGGMGVMAFCVFVRRVQVILDRPANQLLIRRQSVFGYTSVEHALSDLSHAELDATTSRNKGRTSTLYRPVLILSSGMSAGAHPIVAAYTNGKGPDRLVRAVNDWLDAGRENPARQHPH